MLLLHRQLLMMTLCFLVLSLPLMLTSLAWHHLRFVLFPFCLLRSCLLAKGLYVLRILSSGSLVQVLLLEPDVGRLGEMGVDELGLPCPW